MRLSDPHKPVYENWAVSNDYIEPGSGIVMSRIMREGFTCMRYELPDRVGTVWHLLATRATNGRERDADWMLGEYQRPEMRFMRHALPTHVGKFFFPFPLPNNNKKGSNTKKSQA